VLIFCIRNRRSISAQNSTTTTIVCPMNSFLSHLNLTCCARSIIVKHMTLKNVKTLHQRYVFHHCCNFSAQSRKEKKNEKPKKQKNKTKGLFFLNFCSYEEKKSKIPNLRFFQNLVQMYFVPCTKKKITFQFALRKYERNLKTKKTQSCCLSSISTVFNLNKKKQKVM
jgi:hypothetical protein